MKTIVCGGCENVIRPRRLRLFCNGLCGRFFHIPCTDVPLELYHSVCKYPSFAWRCNDCRAKLQFWNPRYLNDYFVEKIKNVVGEMEERFRRFKEELIYNSVGKYKEVMSRKLAYEAMEKMKETRLRQQENSTEF
ncbi:uncharacterized protein LOC108907835 isoform X2 [Anoplophora glabripennis]|uniref:uncharacterized protein LOC108907835 isoform X2 n=1 Tax=Anoplophora glabripennis TaxID=217634 RepID=UPI000875789F|nr:uncharacterized protein LOC108907835 isoform X2 [Anoplophora glabripennis]